MTAMPAAVGVGNTVGVATAVYFGGPGAVFWMWMAGLQDLYLLSSVEWLSMAN
jgi:Na+/alanine symporter